MQALREARHVKQAVSLRACRLNPVACVQPVHSTFTHWWACTECKRMKTVIMWSMSQHGHGRFDGSLPPATGSAVAAMATAGVCPRKPFPERHPIIGILTLY
eukprot:1774985-Pleurochrysis_carterae.AAC.1